jgi:tetratricopeptide (TPR) repeat protein
MKFIALNAKSIFSLIAFFALSLTMINAQDAEEKITATNTYNKALALLKEKNYDEGLPLMKQATAKSKAKAYDEAIAIFKEGIAYDSTNAKNFYGIGNALKKQGKSLDATEYLVQAATMYKEAGKEKNIKSIMKGLNSMSGKAYTSDKFEESITIGEKALAVMDHASISYYVSRSYLETGNNEKALEMATKAIEVSSAADAVEDKYYIAQAKAYVAMGNKADAIAAYEKVTGEKYLEQAKYQIGKLKE